MAKRGPKNQSKHNSKVRKTVNKLKKEGWNVKADLPGFQKPDPIGKGNFIPDIVAKKKGAKRIIEVETPDTMKKDKKQHEAFNRSAAQQNNTTFKIEEA